MQLGAETINYIYTGIEERVAEVAISWKGAGARRGSDSVARGSRHSVHEDVGTGRVRRSSMAEVARQVLDRRGAAEPLDAVVALTRAALDCDCGGTPSAGAEANQKSQERRAS